MDKMRKEFEEWATSAGYITKMVIPMAGEDSQEKAIYANGQTRSAWQAWQASRKALVVELPTTWNASYTDKVIVMDASSVVEALEDAGVAYK